MKYHTRKSFLASRRALAASVAVVLISATPAIAQSAQSGGATENTRRNSQTTPAPAPGTEYQSKAAADVDSTTDVNTRRATSPTSTSRDKLSWGDRRFVTKAADGGQAEVQLAELAAQRATNPEVKSFAQKLVTAHSKVNAELTSLAGQKSIKLDADNEKDRSYKRLSKKTGAEFDQEFVEHMIDEHEKDIKMFEKASTDAKDTDVRSFAAKHVSHLREHLQQAQGLRQAVMPTGRLDDTSGRSIPSDPTGVPSGPSSSSNLPRTDSSSGTRSPRSSTTTDPVRQPEGTR